MSRAPDSSVPSLAGAFLRPRADVRRRMRAWAKRVVARLRELGVEVVARAADEADLQRAVFVPRGPDGAEGRAHLALAIGVSHVEVAIELPVRDARAIRMRLADAKRAQEITATLEGLPEQFTVGEKGDTAHVPVSRLSPEELVALFERAEQEKSALWLGWSVPKEIAVAHATSLDEQLEDATVALGVVFAALLSAIGSTPGRESRGRRSRRDRRGADDESRVGKHRGASEAEHDDDADREVASERLSAGPRDAAVRVQRPAKPILRADSRRRPMGPAVDSRAPIEKGRRVRVLEGPFSGKVGVVQELDGKGGARVMLGLLAVRLEVKDLVACAEGRERPLLSSSHRRPLPVRS